MITLEYLKQKQQELNELMEQYEQRQTKNGFTTQNKKKLNGWHLDDSNQEYYFYISNDNKISSTIFHTGLCNNVNLFINEEKAEEVAFEQFVYRTLKKWRDLHDTEEINWNNVDDAKYYIECDYECNELTIAKSHSNKISNVIYFSTEKLAKQCIKYNIQLLEKYFNI